MCTFAVPGGCILACGIMHTRAPVGALWSSSVAMQATHTFNRTAAVAAAIPQHRTASRQRSLAADQQSSTKSANKVLLVDGLNIAYRTWCGMAQHPLTTSDGIPTSVAFGFLRTVGNVIAAEQPRYLCVVFDAPKSSSTRCAANKTQQAVHAFIRAGGAHPW